MKYSNTFCIKKTFFKNIKEYSFNFNNNKTKLTIKQSDKLLLNRYLKIKCKTFKVTSMFFNTLNYNLIIIDKKNKEYSKSFIKLKGYKLIDYLKK